MYIPLENRGLIRIEGPDARDFLQGLVSQDMQRVTASQAVYSAFLTPQGKFLYDFFCFELGGALILDCEAERRSDFFKRLSMYKLKSDVTLSDVTFDFQVFAVLNDVQKLGLGDERGQATVFDAGVAFVDPRLSAMGARVMLDKDSPAITDAGIEPGALADYERTRLERGLPDGSRDMDVDKALLLEYGFEELDGVCFTKGCFMGQELTARTRYRGLVKKRLLPVSIDGPTPEPGAQIMAGDKQAGEMKTTQGDVGLALMRLDQLTDGATFSCDGATLTVHVPDWVVFQKDQQDA